MNASRAVFRLGVAIVAACTASGVLAFNEAPSLATQVREGKLPTVDKRLPDKPEVIKPFDRIGTYGGTFHSALRANGDVNGITRLIGSQGLTRWSPDFSTVVPNVAESWVQSPDAREFTFRLRHGMKWSDGAPFNADDNLDSGFFDVQANNDTNRVDLFVFGTEERFVTVARLDNLGKGASGAAIQCMNLAIGADEATGLTR